MTHSDRGGNAPAWLFSFVDLAFLLLIAMTQIADDAPARSPELGEVVLPRIEAGAAETLAERAHARWQLRIHPPSDAPAFELVRVADSVARENRRGELDTLRGPLRALSDGAGPKPLLAPHEDSRSQDLLDAVALLETLWPGTRRATVMPRNLAP